MLDQKTIINAFERCFCEQHDSCPGCYQGGPGFGIACRNALCMDVLDLLKAQEAKTGHWIEDETGTYTENHDTWECSECHEPFTLIEGTPEENTFYFCPRCEAKMEGR